MRGKNFNLLETEIGTGSILIEASAGTGKTFTLAGLVLRLLIERPSLTIDRILVTTFTELATAELRGRIRNLLRDALHAFKSGKSEDELIATILKKYPDHGVAAARLNDALLNFDEAPIYTIHGFCERVLAEQAFETGTLFDAELITDERELTREVVSDFWRKHCYRDNSLGTLLALNGGITPKRLFSDLEELVKNPTLRILPPDLPASDAAARHAEQALEELRAIWPDEKESVRALFAKPDWAKGSYKNPSLLARLLEDLEQWLSAEGGTPDQLVSITMLASSEITAHGVLKKAALPQKRTFDACQKFGESAAEFCIALRAEFFASAPDELRRRKQARNVLGFEDLLTRLDDALRREGGRELAQAVRSQYAAALVDEFQDTDPVQYSILERIYRGSDATVAFIGDPKQAIYAFRGADVFTYLNAARETERQFTLLTNRRSESRLVRAVNAVFNRPDAFLLHEIQFAPATTGPHVDEKPLLLAGKPQTPFQIWTSSGKEKLPDCVASEIVRLLERGWTLEGQRLMPGQIAVLTSTNAQAAEMQNALRDRRVPSVLYSSANVFASREARELRDVLAAVTQPGNERLVRAALCSDALGHTGNDIDELSHNDAAWETELLRFQKHHDLWRDRGFIQMLRHLSVEHRVRPRLLSYPDGERRLTNFLHLSESLHTACVENRFGMTGVLKWLGEQMQAGNTASREEHELRLESDEEAVRIITVHKSKGLEFEVAFCPYVWSEAKLRAAFHDPEADYRLTLDLVDGDAHKPRREEEALAEALRLFYVAVTRARHRCTMVWRADANPQKCAPARLLGAGAQPVVASDDITIAEVPGASRQIYRRATETAPHLEPREFTGRVDRSWGITSFSRFVSGHEADILDEGPLLEPPEEKKAGLAETIHAFPRGMHAGTCLHEIIEKIDFANLETAPAIVQGELLACGIEGFDEVVTQNIRQLASLRLSDGTNIFRLADLPNESRIAEMEFSFPISSLTIAKLTEAFAMGKLPFRIERLQFQPINGFINGFIDLVFEHGGRFYFADWKSNWLGPTTRAYHAATIAGEMERNFYLLQLSLYSVALHRYLRVRQPGYDFDQHFGGAFYVFLRGLDPAQPEDGVFFQRPSRAFIENLSRILES